MSAYRTNEALEVSGKSSRACCSAHAQLRPIFAFNGSQIILMSAVTFPAKPHSAVPLRSQKFVVQRPITDPSGRFLDGREVAEGNLGILFFRCLRGSVGCGDEY